MQRWQREINITIGLVTPALVVSFFVGHLSTLLLAVTCFLLIRQTLAVNELEKWLNKGAFGDKRDQKGIWGDIYYHYGKSKKPKRNVRRNSAKWWNSLDPQPMPYLMLR